MSTKADTQKFNEGVEGKVWCSRHADAKCALARRALKLYREAKAGQAAVVLQPRYREGDELHVVVCTGGEQGADFGWLQDFVSDAGQEP